MSKNQATLMKPILMAAKGKGVVNAVKRAGVIGQRYGVTAHKMDQILAHFVQTLEPFNCGATFPIPLVTLARNRAVIEKYLAHNVEIAVHGYYHIDHTRLSEADQVAQLAEARRIFGEYGMTNDGFRCPYLRWNEDTVRAVSRAGFQYDSSQGLVWDVAGPWETSTYHHIIDFYGAVPAAFYPALPRWDEGICRIPYCLPDDESLIDRLHLLPDGGDIGKPWAAILLRTHQLGELFTLGLHPERIHLCEGALVETLRLAQTLTPHVWCTRLDEVTRWWKARSQAQVTVTTAYDGSLYVEVDGPVGTTILTRGVETHATPISPWDEVYQRVAGNTVRVTCERRPFIGVSPASAQTLVHFLRQQGYIVEVAEDCHTHSVYLDRPTFEAEDERRLLQQIERGNSPLVRLGRWPHGARSALVVTGDIDALTIWDYGLRIFGN